MLLDNNSLDTPYWTDTSLLDSYSCTYTYYTSSVFQYLTKFSITFSHLVIVIALCDITFIRFESWLRTEFFSPEINSVGLILHCEPCRDDAEQ